MFSTLFRSFDHLLGQFAEGLCRYNHEKDIWVLTAKDVTKLINVATAVDGQLPKHAPSERNRQPEQ